MCSSCSAGRRRVDPTFAAQLLAWLVLAASGGWVGALEVAPVVSEANGVWRVDYRSGTETLARSTDAAPAGVEVRFPGGIWEPLKFGSARNRESAWDLGPSDVGGLTFRWRLTRKTPGLIERTLEVTAVKATTFAVTFPLDGVVDGGYASFSGPVTQRIVCDTVRGAARTETLPVAMVRTPSTVFGIAADSPGLWENRCQVLLDPTARRIAALAGDGREPYDLVVKPPEDARDTYQYRMDGWQSLAAGESRSFTTWVFASPARSHYDAQMAAHLAIANAKGWNGSVVEAILRNTSYYLLRRNLALDADGRPRDGRYIFVSGPGYGWKQWVSDGFYTALGLDDPEKTIESNRAVFWTRMDYEDNAQYYLIWAVLMKRAGGNVNDALVRRAYEFIRRNERDGYYIPPSLPGSPNPRGWKTYHDVLLYDEDDCPTSNQGFHCGALLAAQELGLPVTDADIDRAIQAYRSLFDVDRGFFPTSRKQRDTLGQDTLYGATLTYAVFGTKLLTDDQVRTHVRTSEKVKSPYGLRVISQADGALLPGHSGVYCYGGSWFLNDAANYLLAEVHGWPSQEVHSLLAERIGREIARVPAFNESISTVDGHPHGHVLYSWNSGYWWLRRELRRRRGETGPDPVDRVIDARLGVTRRNGVLEFETPSPAEEEARLFPPIVGGGEPPDTNYDESKVPPYTLPDPLVTFDGRRVSDPRSWSEVRRPEILRSFERNVYGSAPALPTRVRSEASAPDQEALGGAAIRRQLRIRLLEADDAPWIDLLLYVPKNARGPVPVFLGLNYGNQGVDDDPGIVPSRHSTCRRGEHAARWPLQAILARGYAVATFHGGDVELDRHGSGCRFSVEAWKHGIRYYGLKLGGRVGFDDDEWGSIAAWAWGMSRVVDALQAVPEVDGLRVAVVGHSRTGKTALWAAAEDERIALAISNDSGQGGAALARRKFGETVSASYALSGIWYCRKYGTFGHREAELPVDAHLLIASIAPRPVYVASAAQDGWADPRGEFLAAKHAEPVYALFGRRGVGVDTMPAADQTVGDTVGYHVRTGDHEITAYDWARYLDFADRHLLANSGLDLGRGLAWHRDEIRQPLEVTASEAPRMGTNDFAWALWVQSDEDGARPTGDLIAQYDPAARRGVHLTLKGNVGVTSNQANWRHLQFGVDDDRASTWEDCGRPGRALFAFGLAVHDGALYAGTCEPGEGESGRVYRYGGGDRWEDRGAPDGANAVTAFAVHRGRLFAGTGRYRVAGSSLPESNNLTLGGRVLVHEGGTRWTDCGALPDTEAVGGLVEYRGRLYATSLYKPAGFFRYEEGTRWTSLPVPSPAEASASAPGPHRVESLTVHDGFLYAGSYDDGRVWRYDGAGWTDCGRLGTNTQTYSFTEYRGRLHVGTWPSGRVYRFDGLGRWFDTGRLGQELEVMGMVVHNGRLLAGSLPLAQVYEYDGVDGWRMAHQLDTTPDVRYRRAWTMAEHAGRVFCSTLPSGRIHAFSAGRQTAWERTLSSDWHHVVATKASDRLVLHVDGRKVAETPAPDLGAYRLDSEAPLRMGNGMNGPLGGRFADVRFYRRSLLPEEIQALATKRPEGPGVSK